MSLKKAVLDVLQRVQEELKSAPQCDHVQLLRMALAELRGAALATPDEAPRLLGLGGHEAPQLLGLGDQEALLRQAAVESGLRSLGMPPSAFSAAQATEARLAAIEVGRLARLEEANAIRVLVCEGGPMDGTAASISSQMPLGARTLVGGTVYQLLREDGGREYLGPLQTPQ